MRAASQEYVSLPFKQSTTIYAYKMNLCKPLAGCFISRKKKSPMLSYPSRSPMLLDPLRLR